jgi:formate-dependent nitrite reductase cytochrome c552 subunit
MNRKTLVILAGLLLLTAMILMSCAETPTPTKAPAPPPASSSSSASVASSSSSVASSVAPTAVPPTATKPPATAVPTAAPVPPVAKLDVVAMPGNAALPGAITATVKYITETNTASANVGLYTNGLSNVPINVPVYVQVSAADPKNSGVATWTLAGKPVDSKSVITNVTAITTAMVAKFTPDVVGAYYVQVTLKNAAGATSAAVFAFFNAGTYIGVDAGNCKQCHPTKTAEWAKTGHAVLFSQELDNQVDGPRGVLPSGGYITHYTETCAQCHTTGYYPAPYGGSGGYWDTKAKANWTFPTWKQIDEVFTKKTPSNWAAAPAAVKNMGNIGCEDCHGPANEHVKNGAKVMSVTLDAGVCDQCHAASSRHSKGLELANSKHQTGVSFVDINGPARQACMRCHGAEGFITFVANPKNMASWSTEEGPVGCATCHDPHSDANPFQLRIVGKPVEIPFEVTKNVGLSAICFTCHNGREVPASAVKSTFPHYSSIAEMLSDTGGVTYGQTVPNSPHGMLVGAAPIPTGSTAPGTAKFMFSSIDDAKGNIPGPCVTCHMTAGPTATDPNVYQVGGHSFNTVNPAGTLDYGAACKSCHGDVKDFNLKAKADYDGNGKVEGVQDEIKGLLGVLWKGLEAKGVKKVDTGYPYATLPKDASGNTDDKIDNAFFNYRVVYGVMWGVGADGKPTPGQEGKAQAIHNFKRSCALLQLSLKDLNGSLPAGMTDCTK